MTIVILLLLLAGMLFLYAGVSDKTLQEVLTQWKTSAS